MAGDTISQIKERLSVVDVISGYIKVQKSGANFKARCPFHNEKTPSFYISPERQIWHCFGCQKGGDVFGFVKEIEGVEFPEALRILAKRAGVKIEEYDPRIRDEKSNLYSVCETATRFFEKQLYHSSSGKKALLYLNGRGLKEEVIKEFRLGFAPDDWHSLSNFLRDCDFTDKDIIGAGLALKRENGSDIYDRFRSRIIFPIADINDQIVGFTGRVFSLSSVAKPEETGAKYINTPQTPIYDKSRVLYGLNKGKTETRRQDKCLLVEGNMDAIMSYQAGVKNVAATSGTALTPSHLQLLQRYTSNLDFCFDSDQAGLVATRRGIGLALGQNFNIKIVHLNDPDCKDPADYVKKFGQKWQELTASAVPVLDFYFDKIRKSFDLATVDGKKAIISNLGPLIKRLSSRVEKSHWISKLSAALKVKEADIEADILAFKDDLDSYSVNYDIRSTENESIKIPVEVDIFGEALLAVIIKNPSLFEDQIKKVNTDLFDPITGEIIDYFKKADLSKFEFDKFLKQFEDDKKLKLEFAYLKSQEFLKDFKDEDLIAEFKNIKNKIERRTIFGKLGELELDIKAAESVKDKEKILKLLNKFDSLTQKLKQL